MNFAKGALTLAFALCCGFGLGGKLAQASESVTLTTPRGATVSAIVDVPRGKGPFPAVVLGPGTGSRQQKINDVVAAELLHQGIAVYRFDWAYYTHDAKATPSDSDRSPEIEDFRSVVALARHDPRIDTNRIAVGGKSRGTVIAWQVLRDDPALVGILELTPVCTKAGFTAEQLYPDLAQEKRPSLWLTGDHDPACKVPVLYNFLAGAGGPARVAILRGDHGLADDPTPQLAANLSADFLLSIKP